MPSPEQDEQRDFDSAEIFLRQARRAHETGDEKTCIVSLKLMAVALCMRDEPHRIPGR